MTEDAAPPPRDEQWEVFPCRVEGRPGLVRVDVSLVESAPDPARTWCVSFATSLRSPGADGLMSEPEAGPLEEVEDAFAAAVDHTLAGVLTTGGRRTWYLYVAEVEKLKEQLTDVGPIPHGYDLHITAFHDPQWEHYRKALYPDPVSWGWIQDRRVLAHLAELGDDGSSHRSVSHYAYFPDAAARTAFRAAALALEIPDAAEADAEGDLPCALRLTHWFAPREIFPLAQRLRVAAAEAGGTYDGWETTTVT